MSDKSKIFDKIKKCLALSKSSNQHEAQAALRQAQKLMEAHNISESALLASSVGRTYTKAQAKAKPNQWEGNLAAVVAKSFGCDSLYSVTPYGGYWVFVGINPAPEIAEYTMAVLLRQIMRDRKAFMATIHGNTKRARKTQMADIFCMGWVRSAGDAVHAMVRTKEQEDAIQAFYGDREAAQPLEVTNRLKDKKFSASDSNAYWSGKDVGANVQLHHGVSGKEEQLRIGHV